MPTQVRHEVLPNFFIVGTGKAGTTSLHDYLGQHPQVYVSPIKEPGYFASEVRAANLSGQLERHVRKQSLELAARLGDGRPVKELGWLIGDWDDYLRLFQNAGNAKAIGEASASYLWSETAAENIQAAIPGAKIIMILRDPAERAYSHYLHQLAVGLTQENFREHLAACECADRQRLSIWYPFLEVGLYFQQVKRYLDRFPPSSIRIYWYEEAWQQPGKLLADLFAFLEVDPEFRPDISQKSLGRKAPRLAGVHYLLKKYGIWYPLRSLVPEPMRPRIARLAYRSSGLKMDPRDRRYLVEYYRYDVEKLASLLDRDLSAWLR